MKYFSEVSNSTRFEYSLSWHARNMLIAGIWAHLQRVSLELIHGPEDAGYMLLLLEDAETEIQHLDAWDKSFSGYPQESWEETRTEMMRYLTRARTIAQRLTADEDRAYADLVE